MFLLVAEGLLRLAGYGYSTSFFRPLRIGQTDYLVENDKFGWRFFPPGLARSPPPVVMKAHKTPGTYRVFILGESAALGDPRPAYGPGRYLQALLQQRYPGTEFEVICVAMTAINSHAIVPITRECARHEPDCWILYMGNNEMVGPFGAVTIFGAQAPPRILVRLSLAALKLRLGQLLAAWARKAMRHPDQANSWGGMGMFVQNRLPPGNPKRAAVHQNFAANLKDILRVMRNSHAPLILNTVAVNLNDCPPFASLPATNPTPPPPATLTAAEEQAKLAMATADFQAAKEILEPLATLQPHTADLEYLWAQSLQGLNEPSAKDYFQAACDDDALPFRATSSINAIIRDAAAQPVGDALQLVDGAALFATNAPPPAQVPGKEVFYEHVHFNFDGSYLLGRAWADRIARLLPATPAQPQTDHWASQPETEARLGLTDWNRASVLEDMLLRLQQAPFTAQLYQTQRLAFFRGSLAELRRHCDTNAIPAARGIYDHAIASQPRDHRLRENFAEFLEATGNLALATEQWREVAALLPHHHLGYFQAGRLLALQGKTVEAKTQLLAALERRPDLSEGWFELGKVYAAENNPTTSLEMFGRAQKLFPEDWRVYFQIGKGLSKLGSRSQAIAQFRRAVQLRPKSWQVHNALAQELAFDGQDREALNQFQEVLNLNPGYAGAHLNLGVALFKLGRRNEAKAQFSEALRLNPGNQSAQDYLRQLEKVP